MLANLSDLKTAKKPAVFKLWMLNWSTGMEYEDDLKNEDDLINCDELNNMKTTLRNRMT